ncbi:MAG TPA: hypothetical protein VM580_02860 [Labilithrix sp.]|nr:hypothetical protein [Labilithrix sp.]
MAGLVPVELSADCGACGLEAGVVEVYDVFVAACRFGVPASMRCKLCSAESIGVFDRPLAKPLREVAANRCPSCLSELAPAAIDERRCPTCGASAEMRETSAPTLFSTIADLERALEAWAEREKFPSRQALAAATFSDPDIATVFARLQRGERIEILADPFANMGVRTTSGGAQPSARLPAAASAPEPAIPSGPRTLRGLAPLAPKAETDLPATPITETPSARSVETPAHPPVQLTPPPGGEKPTPEAGAITDLAYAPTEPLARPMVPPPSAPPRALVFPLVSVIAADGEVHPEERALIDRFLVSEGLTPLADHEFSVHHPSTVAHLVPQERREEVVKLMCETASIDGMPDESERRVIRAYASAWNVDDDKLDFWMWGYEAMNTSLARQLFLKIRRFILSARWGEIDSRDL